MTTNDELSPLSEMKFKTVGIVSSIMGLGLATYYYNENEVYTRNHFDLFHKYIFRGQSVLEIGYGGGANFEYYPSGIILTGLDPHNYSTANVYNKFKSKDVQFNGLINGIGESLPWPDETFDVVVTTLVFCTVQNPEKTIKEISRVLKRGGYFLCIEHILGEKDSFLEYQHQLLDPLQQALADGCHLNRATDVLLKDSIPSLFSKLKEIKYLNLPGQWPISRQAIAVKT
eukprot:gene7312-14910_t